MLSGSLSFDVDVSDLDINQCSSSSNIGAATEEEGDKSSHTSAATTSVTKEAAAKAAAPVAAINAFQGSHKCDRGSSKVSLRNCYRNARPIICRFLSLEMSIGGS